MIKTTSLVHGVTARRLRTIAGVVLAAVLAVSLLAALGTRSPGVGLAVSAPVQDSSTRVEAPEGDGYRLLKEQFGPDPVCERKRKINREAGNCRTVFVLRATPRYRDVSRPAVEGGGSLWCRNWKAAMHGLYYVNWKEEIQGTYCYNTSNLTIYRLDYRCGYGYGIGYSVETKECFDQRRACEGCTAGWMISVYDQFKVSAIARGIPLFKTHQFHVNLHPTGTVTAYKG